MERNKKWFSFVEIIIVISILILLWFVVMKISGDSKQKTINATIESQLSNLWVALNSEITEKKELSLPNGTLNYFNKEWWYSHENFSDKDSESIWVYGVLSQSNFLSEIPRDPRNNQYYAYGLLKDKQTFEVAWVIKNWADYLAKISGNYTGDKWTISLIREYNWPYFIADWEGKLPYNPEKVLLTATDKNWNSFEEKDVLEYRNWKIFKNNAEIWKIADLATEENWKKYYDLYFSEWSIARLDLKDDIDYIKLTFWRDNDLFTFVKWNDKSKIAMFLDAGSMWIFAWSQRESDSDFSVTTADTTAAVRWTVFWVNADKRQFTLVKWKIDIIKRNSNPITLNPGERFIIDRKEKTRVDIPADKIPYPLNKVTENKGGEFAPDVVVYELPDDCYNSDCIKRTVKSESLVDSEERTIWEISLDEFYEWKKFYKSKIDPRQWDLPVTKSWVQFELRYWNIVFDPNIKVKISDNIYYSANCFRIYKDDNLTKFWNICKDGKYRLVPDWRISKIEEEKVKIYWEKIKSIADVVKEENKKLFFWSNKIENNEVKEIFLLKDNKFYVYNPEKKILEQANFPLGWLNLYNWKCFKQDWEKLLLSNCGLTNYININFYKGWELKAKSWVTGKNFTDLSNLSSEPRENLIAKKGKFYREDKRDWENLEIVSNVFNSDKVWEISNNILVFYEDKNGNSEQKYFWILKNQDLNIIKNLYTIKQNPNNSYSLIKNTLSDGTFGSWQVEESDVLDNFNFYIWTCFEVVDLNTLKIKQECREKTSDLVANTCIIPESRKTTTCPNKEMNTKEILKGFRYNYNIGKNRTPSIEYKTFVNLNVYLYEKDWKLYFKNQNWTNWVIFYPNENENKNKNPKKMVTLNISTNNVNLDTGKAYHASCFSIKNTIDRFNNTCE